MKKVSLKQIKNLTPAEKASFALLIANLVLKGLSLISGPVFTRIMSTEQYGIVSTFQSWLSLLTVVVTLNLSQGVFNNGMLDFKKDRDKFQFSLLFISSVITLAYAVAFFALKKYVLSFTGLTESMVVIMLLYFFFVPAYQLWSGRQRYEYKYKALSIITIVSAIVSLILGVIFVLNASTDNQAIARIRAMEGVNIIIGFFFYITLAKKARFKIDWNYCKYALRFNVPLIPHYLSMYVLASSDRIMITQMVSASATAIYSVAYTVASVINIVWSSIEASLSPWIYENLDKGNSKEVKIVTIRVVAIFGILCMVATLFAPEIMRILAPKQYSEGVYAIPAIAVGVFFTAVYSLYMRIELFYKQTGFATVASTIAAISNIILNYIFIKLRGYIAAGYTTMVCYALLAFFHYLNTRKKGYSYIIDNRKMFILSLTIILVSFSIIYLYKYPVIRLTGIGIVLIILFIKRNNIIRIFKLH